MKKLLLIILLLTVMSCIERKEPKYIPHYYINQFKDLGTLITMITRYESNTWYYIWKRECDWKNTNQHEIIYEHALIFLSNYKRQ